MGVGTIRSSLLVSYVPRLQRRAVFLSENPTQPSHQTVGLMTTIDGKPDSSGFGHLLEVRWKMKDEAPVAASSKKGASGRIYIMEEIEKHNTKEDVWIVVNVNLYHLTD